LKILSEAKIFKNSNTLRNKKEKRVLKYQRNNKKWQQWLEASTHLLEIFTEAGQFLSLEALASWVKC
jgi:hypothetical protein